MTSSETKGLQLVVSDCSGGWTAADGTCSGTKTTLLTSPLATLGSDKNFSGVTALAANSGVLHLQFSVSLPNSTANDETSVNGVLPAGTIQGLSAALTWTLSETQRDAASWDAVLRNMLLYSIGDQPTDEGIVAAEEALALL